MRSYVPQYELLAPATLVEALDLMSEDSGGWRPLAGGTDVMVVLEAGRLEHTRFISLARVKELRFIDVRGREVEIGASTTYTDIRRHPLLEAEFPMLGMVAAETGGIANQNRGTLGGNIANASPAADTPPALLAYDAELELVSGRGKRNVPYDRFHTGYKKMDLAPDELIRSIRLPRREGPWRQFYRKVGTRRAQAISKVCIGAAMRIEDGRVAGIRIGLASVAPTVIRARRTETAVTGRTIDAQTIAAAREAAAADIAPIDDIRSTADYRRQVTLNLVEEFLTTAGQL